MGPAIPAFSPLRGSQPSSFSANSPGEPSDAGPRQKGSSVWLNGLGTGRVQSRRSRSSLSERDRARFVLPFAAGKPRLDLLEQPAVPVWILKRGKREVGTIFRIAPSDARVLQGVVEGAAGVMEYLAHVDAAGDQVARGKSGTHPLGAVLRWHVPVPSSRPVAVQGQPAPRCGSPASPRPRRPARWQHRPRRLAASDFFIGAFVKSTLENLRSRRIPFQHR